MEARVESRARWLAASLIWVLAGFLFPFLSPATALMSGGLQRYLIPTVGMSEELAFRVAFTIFRIPLTAVLGILAAAAQFTVVRGVLPLARRWIIAAAVGACISTLIFLPSTLVAPQIVGDTFTVRMFLLVLGAALLAGLASLLQWRTAHREVFVPGWFVPASALAAALGVFGELGLT